MSDRENLRRVLAENGVGEPGASLHGWRCEHPDRYGPCGCVDELLDDLAPLLAEAERRGAERGWKRGVRDTIDARPWSSPLDSDNPYLEGK